MKKIQITQILCALVLLLALTGCSTEQGADFTEGGTDALGISTVEIEPYENLIISDWPDADTVVVSKENESLGKMQTAELSDSYPRSLYLYHIADKEYTLLKARKDLNLDGATLSPDRKNLLYYGSSLGDLSYYVLNLKTLKEFAISGEPIGSAGSAHWADNDIVIGAGYTNGAYYADMTGKITPLEELDGENVFLVAKINNIVYYNTQEDNTLMALDLSTKETSRLNLSNVVALYPAPDGSRIALLQNTGEKQRLLLCDTNGDNAKTPAEGTEIGGVAWSHDRAMLAYSVNEESSDTTIGGLYLYDPASGKAAQIAADVRSTTTCWSPTGKELAYTEWDGSRYHSGIVHLEYTEQK